MWNDLPADVVTASSVKAFKNKLEARQSNRIKAHRSSVFTCVSLCYLYASVTTAYLIGCRDTSHCPKYINIEIGQRLRGKSPTGTLMILQIFYYYLFSPICTQKCLALYRGFRVTLFNRGKVLAVIVTI